MTERRIETEHDIAEGCAWLSATCPRMAHAHALAGPPPLRRREGGFDALLRSIVSQQLSVASAEAVWRRVAEAGLTAPEAVLAAGEETLRATGLSRQKIAYARALAEAGLDYDALQRMPVGDAVAELTAVKGIGVWTAEIYLMFSAGRADVFAPGDLALQEAARMLYDLPERPREKDLRARAEAWSPWRAVAARLLWSYYRVARDREGIAV